MNVTVSALTIQHRISALREVDEFAYANIVGALQAIAHQNETVHAALIRAVEQVERSARLGVRGE